MQPCPSHNELELVLAGGLDQTRHQEVYGRIDECRHCLQALDDLSEATSTLVQTGASQSTQFHNDPVLRQLIERLGENPPLEFVSSGKKEHGDCDESIQFPLPPTDAAPLGQLGPYNILEQLASGSTGILFKAFDTTLDREVAIKVLRGELAASESYRARLEREARAVASLSHDHIVTVH